MEALDTTTTVETEARVKGTVLAARVQYAAEHEHEELVRWKAELSPEAQELVEAGPLVNGWYPFSLFIELNESIDRVWGSGDHQLCRTLGGASFDRYSKTIYRLVFRAISVDFLVRRARIAWRLHYEAGELASESEVLDDGRKRVLLRILDMPNPHPAHCQSVRGWIVRAAEMTGAEAVEERCVNCRQRGADECQFEVLYR